MGWLALSGSTLSLYTVIIDSEIRHWRFYVLCPLLGTSLTIYEDLYSLFQAHLLCLGRIAPTAEVIILRRGASLDFSRGCIAPSGVACTCACDFRTPVHLILRRRLCQAGWTLGITRMVCWVSESLFRHQREVSACAGCSYDGAVGVR